MIQVSIGLGFSYMEMELYYIFCSAQLTTVIMSEKLE